LINDNKGTIINISKDKTKIKILLLKGGTVTARNEGFEKGDKVCFILNAAKTEIVKVIPKLIADVTEVIGSNPILGASTEEQPEDLDQNFDEYEYYDEEITIEEEENNGSKGKTTRNTDERERETEFTLSDGG
jgi:hypothetical protein